MGTLSCLETYCGFNRLKGDYLCTRDPLGRSIKYISLPNLYSVYTRCNMNQVLTRHRYVKTPVLVINQKNGQEN